MVVLFRRSYAKPDHRHIDERGVGQGDALVAKVVADPKAQFVLATDKVSALHQRSSAAPASVRDEAIQQPGLCRIDTAHFDDHAGGPGAAAGIQHVCGEMAQASLLSDR